MIKKFFLPIISVSSLFSATFTVTNTNSTGAGSLSEAIFNRDFVGTASDEIVFQNGVTGSINLTNVITPLTNLVANQVTTITGPVDGNGTPTITINGQENFRGFSSLANTYADITHTVTIRNFIIQNAHEKGGTGAGGGAGFGGGLFVGENNTVTISNVQFTNCKAIGGDAYNPPGRAGGGGMSRGNGGTVGSEYSGGGGGGGFAANGGSVATNPGGESGGGGGGGALGGTGGSVAGGAAGGGGGGGVRFAGGAGSTLAGGGGGGLAAAGGDGANADGGDGADNANSGGDAGTPNGDPSGDVGQGGGGGGSDGTIGGQGGAAVDPAGGGGGGAYGTDVRGPGGDSVVFGGGGGGVVLASGGAGGFAGGGGGSGGSSLIAAAAGNNGGPGGYGGGGGGAGRTAIVGLDNGVGGSGGFGGGGGGATSQGTPGTGGYGAGDGDGGAGSGFGGAIFVQTGGNLIIESATFAFNGAEPGTHSAGAPGISGGDDIYLHGLATLTFNNTSDILIGTIGGGLGGIPSIGTVTKQGSGTVTISGTASYGGPTVVSAGTLSVTGTIESSTITVGTSGTLRGTGQTAALVVNGTLFPGASIGTLNVVGNVTQNSGSTLQLEFDGATSSKVNVTGSMTIADGATIELVPLAGTYSAGTEYTLIETTGGLTGTFSTLTVTDPSSLLGGLSPELTYTATSLLMGFGSGISACDQTSVYLNAFSAEGARAFQGNLLTYQHQQRMVDWTELCKEGLRSFWVGDYAHQKTDEADFSVVSSYKEGGFLFGLEGVVNDHLVVGTLGGYSWNQMKAFNRCAKEQGIHYTAGAYVQGLWEKVTADLSFLYTYSFLHPKRLSVGSLVNDGKTKAYGLTGLGELLYNLQWNKAHFSPLVTLQYGMTKVQGYTEETTKSAQFLFGNDHIHTFNVGVGGLFWYDVAFDGGYVRPQLRLVWSEDVLTDTHKVAMHQVSNPTNSANVTVRQPSNNGISLSGGLNAFWNSCVSLEAMYEAKWRFKGSYAQDARLGVTWHYGQSAKSRSV